ncbi:MAG: hypothetical protein CO141_00865 [Candidatus Moranbacteria bacterium CG_4_9_14_3_um_filter_42_9]|nr:MAG: hypothetical protein CO141_00865 [Candidatus Moranbacteria bacterium CG_4_9_14_3_um_filter_42_9]
MFEDKNKKSGGNDLSQNKEFRPSNIPIHTMLGDLLELEHPKKAVPFSAEQISQPPIKNNLTEAQKTSPFLNQLQDSASSNKDSSRLKIFPEVNVPRPPAKKIDVSEIKKDLFIRPEKKLAEAPRKETGQNRTIGKLIGAIAIILIIIALGGGGYYFWMNKQKELRNNSTPEPIIETPVESEPVAEAPQKTPKFSLEKPNYLQVDPAATEPDAWKNTITEYLKEVEKENVVGPVEFTVVDKENNPVGFPIFSKNLGIVFSKNILVSLKETFSLFFYKDGENYRLGISLDYKDGVNLKNLMLLEEPRLMAGLKPLFLDAQYIPIKVQRFSNNAYKNLPVRYLNIVSPEYLSIDYVVSSKALLIGTTRMTTKVVIDHLNPETEEMPQQTE